jgi:hypothetical protein
VDFGQVAELAITALLRGPTTMISSTGVVIAGFGDHDYFPGYHEYECHGLLLGKFLWKNKESKHIDFNTPSHINAFAMTAMVRTFQMGFSRDVYGNVVAELQKALKSFSDKIQAEMGAAVIPNLDAHIKDVVEVHTDTWTQAAWAAHGWPLSRLIGSLPVDEMAELAETLIMLESLKEKVTKPTASVGGPIDVAVITKGDGFIWIKRKHYFDPKLNPRFLRRQGDQK